MDRDAAALAASLADDYKLVHVDDEHEIREQRDFIPVYQYRDGMMIRDREIGMLHGKHIILTDLHEI